MPVSSSHGVRGNLDLHLSLPFPSGLGVIGGVGSLSTGSPSGRGSGYLGLMYSQAPVRSYTKDRAGLQGDHTPKGGGYKVKNRNSSCGNLCRPHWTQVVAYHCLSVLCGGKGTAPGCAPRGSPKVPSGHASPNVQAKQNPKNDPTVRVYQHIEDQLTRAGSEADDILALTTTREGATNLRNYFTIAGKKANAETAVKVAGATAKHCIVIHGDSTFPQWRRTQPRL